MPTNPAMSEGLFSKQATVLLKHFHRMQKEYREAMQSLLDFGFDIEMQSGDGLHIVYISSDETVADFCAYPKAVWVEPKEDHAPNFLSGDQEWQSAAKARAEAIKNDPEGHAQVVRGKLKELVNTFHEDQDNLG